MTVSELAQRSGQTTNTMLKHKKEQCTNVYENINEQIPLQISSQFLDIQMRQAIEIFHICKFTQ